jgi:hypothetical protein
MAEFTRDRVIDPMRDLLVAFTDECWDYDTISCAICDGSIDWDVEHDGDGEHDRFAFVHKADCLWVRAHELLGRDLGLHSTEGMDSDA